MYDEIIHRLFHGLFSFILSMMMRTEASWSSWSGLTFSGFIPPSPHKIQLTQIWHMAVMIAIAMIMHPHNPSPSPMGRFLSSLVSRSNLQIRDGVSSICIQCVYPPHLFPSLTCKYELVFPVYVSSVSSIYVSTSLVSIFNLQIRAGVSSVSPFHPRGGARA